MNDSDVSNPQSNSAWILVADARRARVLEPRTEDGALVETDVFERLEARPVAAGNGRVWVAADDGFAEAITRFLGEAFAAGRFARLVLVAPEPMLDAIYEALSPPVRSALDLLAEADLVDADPGVVRACLPGGIAGRQVGA